MNTHTDNFSHRFATVQQKRRLAVGLIGLGALATAFTAVVAIVAAIDFRWELDASVRTGGLVAGVLIAMGVVAWLLVRVWRRWGAASTAAEVEQLHPEFGQRVRTTVQFAQQSDSDLRHVGVEPRLVEALGEETDTNVLPGEMEQVVPTRRSLGSLALGFAAAALLGLSLLGNWEWQTAVLRTIGVSRAYTTLTVTPGDSVIDEGATLPIEFTITGRPREQVVVESRPAHRNGVEWVEETLDLASARAGDHEWSFAVELKRIREPMEYRVIAGPVSTPTHRIDVRYPLEIQSVSASLLPPEYTGLKPREIPDGNLTGLRGTQAEITVQLDRVPAKAEATFTRVGTLPQDAERTSVHPVTIDGPNVRFEVDLQHDLIWSLAAADGDGTSLPDNAFRIRVQPDRPPKVSFQEPEAELEVHTLAEVLMRIRATDDYGLSRSGIVFQINNGEEHTLLEEDFAAALEATEEIDSNEPLSHRTRVTLERLLPLEYFSLTEKDSVMYYAFAVDNFPETPQRAESDWRFVDIRPFRMRFRAPDPNDPNGGAGSGRRPLTSLEELIRRERYTLNRTVKLDRRNGAWSDKEIGTIDRLIDYQAEIASLTRELAERLSEFGISEEVDVLFQAETSMLGAVDTLTIGEFGSAVLQEKDAHQYLIEARNRLLVQLANNAQLRRALMQFNQRMRQKLRRNRQQQNVAQSLVRRLQQLASNQQQTSSQALAAAMAMNGSGGARSGSAEPANAGTDSTDPPRAVEDESTESIDADSEPETTDGRQPSEMDIDPEELEERQYAAVEEARDLLDQLDEVPELTNLVRERMEVSTNLADEAAMSFSQGNVQQAGEQTAETAEQFGELARQVEALVAREISDRIAATRGIASRLADEERELTARLGEPSEDESADDENEMEPSLAARANRVQEGARTLEDVLTALSDIADADAGDAPERVAEIIDEQQITQTVQRAMSAAERAVEDEPPPEVAADLEDTAERFELTSSELDRLYRSLVMPRMARLRELERELTATQQGMDPQETEQDVEEFTADLEELIRDLEDAQAGGASREELFEMVENRKLPAVGQWQKIQEGAAAAYTAPDLLRRLLSQTGEELRRQIHELMLADLQADRESPIPPEYEQLVDEYLRVLAADSDRF